jgi:hypothetical protein
MWEEEIMRGMPTISLFVISIATALAGAPVQALRDPANLEGEIWPLTSKISVGRGGLEPPTRGS